MSKRIVATIGIAAILSACGPNGGREGGPPGPPPPNASEQPIEAAEVEPASETVVEAVTEPAVETAALPSFVAAIDPSAMIGEPSLVDCTLSGSTQTKCVSFTLTAAPTTLEVGPWCPRNISDGPEVSGIWLESGQVYDADGAFIENLAEFYGDDVWQMFDPETGAINVTDSKISCAAAARPDVDEEYQNHCVECLVSYLDEGLSQTYVIPVEPVAATRIGSGVGRSGVGVTLTGARLDAPAPTDDILSAHTLAPFDDCGGHVNLNVGYHIHAVTDCHEGEATADGQAFVIGVALDGYMIHARLNPDGSEPEGLDACGGHESDEHGYHYHAGAPGSNAILGCHTGQTGCVLTDGGTCDASADTDTRRGPPPNGEGRGGPPPRD